MLGPLVLMLNDEVPVLCKVGKRNFSIVQVSHLVPLLLPHAVVAMPILKL